MKKKIKDLTTNERLDICDKHVYDHCDRCPFMLFVNNTNDHYCVHQILNVLEREVELDDQKEN